MTITPQDATVIADAIDSRLIDVHVSLPGTVVTYDPDTQTAQIELQLQRLLPTDAGPFVPEDLPILQNVPVQFFRNKLFAVTLPLKKGDTGNVVFCEMSLDQWRSKGVKTTPADILRHGLSGAVFTPGLSHNADALKTAAHASNMVIGLDGDNAQIHITPSGSVLIGADATLGAARVTDPIEAIIPINTVVVNVTGGSGAPAVGVKNTSPIVLDGEITAASATVKVSD